MTHHANPAMRTLFLCTALTAAACSTAPPPAASTPAQRVPVAVSLPESGRGLPVDALRPCVEATERLLALRLADVPPAALSAEPSVEWFRRVFAPSAYALDRALDEQDEACIALRRSEADHTDAAAASLFVQSMSHLLEEFERVLRDCHRLEPSVSVAASELAPALFGSPLFATPILIDEFGSELEAGPWQDHFGALSARYRAANDALATQRHACLPEPPSPPPATDGSAEPR